MARKAMSKAARAKLSRAAKSRPRTKAGKFKKGGRARRKPAKKRRKSASKRRRSNAKPARKAARRRSPSKKRKRNRKGQFVRTGSSAPRRRRVRDTPAPRRAPRTAPLDLGILNPTDTPIAEIAKTAAGVASGMIAGKAAASYSGQTGLLAEAIQVGTPIAVGMIAARLGAPTIGTGMVAAGGAMAAMIATARVLKMIPQTRELGARLSGMAGNGATTFMQDDSGRVFVRGADGSVFRLEGLGDTGTEPLVSVLLSDGTKRGMNLLGRVDTEAGPFHVLRDPQSRELAAMPLGGIVAETDQFRGRALSGIVAETEQFSDDRSISGMVLARDQFRSRSLSGMVSSESQYANRNGADAVMDDGDAELY